ncbi:ABC transporter permease subunit [Bacillus sp. NPDC077027]|uniref:ABC transporter permease subunit n=1 Tax=Bacillus sp. NPDC077027 TaxID=3390548 RepID=UPI003CFBF679
MVSRQLLFKEWKQMDLTFILVMIVGIFATPLSVLMDYSSFQTCLKDVTCETASSQFSLDFHTDTFISVSWSIGLLFAMMQLGMERNKGQLDFTLSLPFSRATIYNTKFFLGAGIIAVIHIASFTVTYFVLLGIRPSHTLGFKNEYMAALIACLMVYSLFLAAGALTGGSVAQAIVAMTTAILPFLMIGLPLANLDIVFKFRDYIETYALENMLSVLSPLMYLTNENPLLHDSVLLTHEQFIIPCIMFILFYLIGLLGFLNHPVERNGRFFLYSKLDRPIQIIVIILGVLGFGWIGYSSNSSMFGYLIGMIIGGIIGILISYFLIYRKR